MQSYSHFFSKNISIYMYAIFNDQSFNDTLTNNIISFEQLVPDKPAHLCNLSTTFIASLQSYLIDSVEYTVLTLSTGTDRPKQTV